jgi:hypothetical protein
MNTVNTKAQEIKINNKQFKDDLMTVFHKHGYLEDGKDYEVKIKTTSGNIAWININRIEIIK